MALSDVDQSMEVVNELARTLWPGIRDTLNQSLTHQVVPDMNELLRARNLDMMVTLQVLDFQITGAAPLLSNPQVSGRTGDFVEFSFDVESCTDIDFSMYAMGTVVGVTALTLSGTIVVRTSPLLNEMPLCDSLFVFFRRLPSVKLALAEYFTFPAADRVMESVIQSALSRFLVAPNALLMPLADSFAEPCCTMVDTPSVANNWPAWIMPSIGLMVNANSGKTELGATLSRLPSAVKPRPARSGDWLNHALELSWKRMSRAFETMLKNSLEPVINDALGRHVVGALGSVKVAQFSCGQLPPKLGKPKASPLVSQLDERGFEVSFDLEFQSHIDVRLTVLSTDITIQCTPSDVELVVRLTSPTVRGLFISCRQPPKLDMNFSGLARMAHLPGVGRALKQAIVSYVGKTLVMPHGIAVPVTDALWEYDDDAVQRLAGSSVDDRDCASSIRLLSEPSKRPLDPIPQDRDCVSDVPSEVPLLPMNPTKRRL